MPRKTKDIRAALSSKGFEAVQTHHVQMWLSVAGKKTGIHTFLSHGMSEYPDNLLAKMARQLKLDRSDLNRLLDCPMSRTEYVTKLAAAGHVDPEE